MKSGSLYQTNQQRLRPAPEAGFGLIEALIASAVISIIALGLMTLMEDMSVMQRKSNIVGVIQNLRGRIIANIQKGASWSATVSDVTDATGNPYMACMNGGTQCTHGTSTALNLKDEAGAAVYSARTTDHGFTDQGIFCTTYPVSPCSFRWNLAWIANCPSGGGTCLDPNVRVTGTVEFTEGAAKVPGGFNSALYSIDVLRGAEVIRNDPILIANIRNDTNSDGTQCHRTQLFGWGNWGLREVNTVVADPGDNVVNKVGTALTSGGQGRITLRAGVYNCRVQAPAFRSGGNQIRLVSSAGTTLFGAESTIARATVVGGATNVILDVTLVLNQQTTFRVEHRCSQLPSEVGINPNTGMPYGNAIAGSWMGGVPSPDSSGNYTNVVYTTVSCTRTS